MSSEQLNAMYEAENETTVSADASSSRKERVTEHYWKCLLCLLVIY